MLVLAKVGAIKLSMVRIQLITHVQDRRREGVGHGHEIHWLATATIVAAVSDFSTSPGKNGRTPVLQAVLNPFFQC